MAKGGAPCWALGHMTGVVTMGVAWVWGIKGSSTRPHVTPATTKKGVCPIFGCLTIICQFSGFLPYFSGFLLFFVEFWPKRVDLEPRKRQIVGRSWQSDPNYFST